MAFYDRNSPMVIAETERAQRAQLVYHTATTYDEQYATVGRGVVMRIGSALVAGIIQQIHPDGQPCIFTPGASSAEALVGFHPTGSEERLLAMPDRHWTWPPRVDDPKAITYSGNTA